MILGWQVIVKKGEFKPGDYVVFIEPDAILPERPEFEFLRPKKFRIKTMKMGGVLSQGICFPLSVVPGYDKKAKNGVMPYSEGDDLTGVMGIRKVDEYEDEQNQNSSDKKNNWLADILFSYNLTRPLARLLFAKTKRDKKGFPDFISKTDETRIQTIPRLLLKKDIRFVGREKVDGQSGTFALKRIKSSIPFVKDKFDFIVCSRNLRLDIPDNSSYWSVAKLYNIKTVLFELMRDFDNPEWIAIQGECIAPTVQGNRYKVDRPDLYCFNLILPSGKVPCVEAERIVGKYGLKWVPLVVMDYCLPDTVNEVLDFATGKSALADTMREGVVFRNYEKGISFKAVSPDYLISHNE